MSKAIELDKAVKLVLEVKGNDPEHRLWLHRFKLGKLSTEKKEEIVKKNGYKPVKQSTWKKK